MSRQNRIQECLLYFNGTPVLKKILMGFYDKYRSFGMVCGTVILRNLDVDEMEAVEGLTGKNYHGKKSASLSAKCVQSAIDNSKYAGVRLEELLAELCKGELESKKSETNRKKECFQLFFDTIVNEFSETRSGMWLRNVLQNQTIEERTLQKHYKDAKKKDLKKLEQSMHILMNALNHLPTFCGDFEYLPAFAARFAKDPHHFDEGKADTVLFYYGISKLLGNKEKISATMPAEQKHQLLFQAGLIRDSMSNDALVYGIHGYDREGREHLGVSGFYEQKEPFSLTLSTIMKLERVTCNQKCIYAVENPIVFAKLIEDKSISAICVNGQPNLAVILLLDKMQQDGTNIYYNGDFDPEGLLIAERLKNRYQKNLSFWHYEEEDYQKALSDKIISEKRLKMLDRLTYPKMIFISEKIRIDKRAGYQERIFF